MYCLCCYNTDLALIDVSECIHRRTIDMDREDLRQSADINVNKVDVCRGAFKDTTANTMQACGPATDELTLTHSVAPLFRGPEFISC